MLLHKTEKVTHSVQCLLTNKYLDVISSAKASKSTKQICGVVGGRFYQQVDFSRSKQRHVWAGMCRTERGSGLYLAPAAASVSAENLSLLNRREHHSREMRPNPSIQARREGGKGWEQPMRRRGGNVCMREDYYIRCSLSSTRKPVSGSLSVSHSLVFTDFHTSVLYCFLHLPWPFLYNILYFCNLPQFVFLFFSLSLYILAYNIILYNYFIYIII